MNLLIAIIDGIVGFIRRNPLFCLLIFLLALFAPSVLGGIAMFVLYALLGLVVLAIILLLSFRWRIYRMRKDLEDQFGGQGFGPGGSGGPAGNAREGEIHIRKTKGAGEKRGRNAVEWICTSSRRAETHVLRTVSRHGGHLPLAHRESRGEVVRIACDFVRAVLEG